jgi:two-component system response regulator FixJ
VALLDLEQPSANGECMLASGAGSAHLPHVCGARPDDEREVLIQRCAPADPPLTPVAEGVLMAEELPAMLPNDAAQHIEPGPSRNVYIVDDDASVRRSVSFALATAGFAVRAFVTGRDFLDAADTLAPGCVLLDLRMPDLGGFAVLRELGERRRRFPVVTITGYGDIETAVSAMKLGSRDFLEKPFSDAALLSVLDTVFASLPRELEAEGERLRAEGLVAGLTPRERELLQGLVAGLSNKGVANKLGVSVRTIEMHRGNLMDRLGVKSLADAVRIALLADGALAT